jgi:hypothetical protein
MRSAIACRLLDATVIPERVVPGHLPDVCFDLSQGTGGPIFQEIGNALALSRLMRMTGPHTLQLHTFFLNGFSGRM